MFLLLPMLVAIAALGGCSSPNAQEENLVRQYFRASGLRDNQTLANFAVVAFDPKVEGVVTDFDVTAVSEKMDGTLVSKDISVAATVRGPDGATSRKNYLVTVQRAVVKGATGERNGKWIITAIKPA